MLSVKSGGTSDGRLHLENKLIECNIGGPSTRALRQVCHSLSLPTPQFEVIDEIRSSESGEGMKVDKPCLHRGIVQASGLQNNVYFLQEKLDEKRTKLHVLALFAKLTVLTRRVASGVPCSGTNSFHRCQGSKSSQEHVPSRTKCWRSLIC